MVTLAFGAGLGDPGAKARAHPRHIRRGGEKLSVGGKELVMKGTCLVSPAWILGPQRSQMPAAGVSLQVVRKIAGK